MDFYLNTPVTQDIYNVEEYTNCNLGYYLFQEDYNYEGNNINNIFDGLSDVRHNANDYSFDSECKFNKAACDFEVEAFDKNGLALDISDFTYLIEDGIEVVVSKAEGKIQFSVKGEYDNVIDYLNNFSITNTHEGSRFNINGSFNKENSCGDLVGTGYGFNLSFGNSN